MIASIFPGIARIGFSAALLLLLTVGLNDGTLPTLTAQDANEGMIESLDFDEQDVQENWQERIAVVPTSISPTWTGVLQAVLMTRDDSIDLRWNDFGTQRVSTVESDLNSGFRIALTRQLRGAATQEGKVFAFSVLRVSGEGKTEFRPGKIYSNEGDFLTSRFGLGLNEVLLSGRSYSTIGVRYSRLADQIDYALTDSIAAAKNDAVTIDLSTTGWWEWRQAVFSAGLAGGFGGNHVDQHGVRLDGSSVRFSQQSVELATVSEANADVLWPIFDRTYLQVGARGIVLTGVAQARDTWGRPGDVDSVWLAGMTFGIWKDF